MAHDLEELYSWLRCSECKSYKTIIHEEIDKNGRLIGHHKQCYQCGFVESVATPFDFWYRDKNGKRRVIKSS